MPGGVPPPPTQQPGIRTTITTGSPAPQVVAFLRADGRARAAGATAIFFGGAALNLVWIFAAFENPVAWLVIVLLVEAGIGIIATGVWLWARGPAAVARLALATPQPTTVVNEVFSPLAPPPTRVAGPAPPRPDLTSISGDATQTFVPPPTQRSGPPPIEPSPER